MNNKWPLGGHYIHIKKTAPLPGGHVFSLITTIFNSSETSTKLIKKTPPGGHVFLPIQTIIKLNCLILVWKNAPPLGSHVFQAKVTIFELIQDIIGTNQMSKFHEDRKINVASRPYKENAPPPGGHVFQPTDIIF
ncbi:hypothetical protein DPMN_003826 [Dreissena polymorpha]|uniref:Uncharacterized protein n=1 Tax=Dreissena polymorpha TaxID=45954 RepID=A0A9D4RSF4_DREPO|nr:hypothetical protein DPMN_003826 [Dreissena polymorpha]